jgi:hypothetical protein
MRIAAAAARARRDSQRAVRPLMILFMTPPLRKREAGWFRA